MRLTRLLFVLLFICRYGSAIAQTFFETAKDDGIIAFKDTGLSQIKINPTSTAISYGYYYLNGKATASTRFILNVEVKAKPNDDGLATLVKTGNLQPGVQANIAAGIRINDPFKSFFSVFDIYVKPSFQLDGLSIYDTSRIKGGQEAFYKTNKASFGLNGLINILLSPGPVNIFIGLQKGPQCTNNSDDMDKGTLQVAQPALGGSNQTLFSDSKEVKVGQLSNVTKSPFKADLIFDPRIHFGRGGTNMELGFFGYYRTDGKLKKYREGFGICFLNGTNPSKIFSSAGYELPTYGSDVNAADRKVNKGQVFFTIGFSIN